MSFPLISSSSSLDSMGTPASIFFIRPMNLSVYISWSLISSKAFRSSSLLPVLSSSCFMIFVKTASRLLRTSFTTLNTYCSNSSYWLIIYFWLFLIDNSMGLESMLSGVMWLKYFLALLMTILRGLILCSLCCSLKQMPQMTHFPSIWLRCKLD